MMTLFKVINIEAVTTLDFSVEALLQTVYVFALMYGLSLLMNYIFIRRQTIVSLFSESSSTEDNTRRLTGRSEEHTSELQSRGHLVCRLLLEKKKEKKKTKQ